MERAIAIAEGAAAIVEVLRELPSESTRLRAVAAANVALELDADALRCLDQAHKDDHGRCARCGRTYRQPGTGQQRW